MSVRKDSYVWIGVALTGAAIGVVIVMLIIDMMRPRLTLHLGDGVFVARVVKTEAERAKGLAGAEELPRDQAMFFTFAQDDLHGVWMKGMYIPIDIVWLDKDKKVVHMVRYVTPDTFPTVYKPKTPARYVVELAAGTIDERAIKIGAVARFDERRVEEGVE